MTATANTQIANLNEQNLEAILAAIKVLRKRTADEQRARDRLERRSDAAADRYVAAVNELTKRISEYFESQHQDPGGCVSDPSSESCLDHLDEIQDSAVREKFKADLEKLDSRRTSEEASFNMARDALGNEERDAYADYQKTLDGLGKRFARRAGTITGQGVSLLSRCYSTQARCSRIASTSARSKTRHRGRTTSTTLAASTKHGA